MNQNLNSHHPEYCSLRQKFFLFDFDVKLIEKVVVGYQQLVILSMNYTVSDTTCLRSTPVNVGIARLTNKR